MFLFMQLLQDSANINMDLKLNSVSLDLYVDWFYINRFINVWS